MNNRPYNDESIRQYLLGTLSEAETDRLDELSFTDDEFVDAVNAVERDLIDAYVQDRLRNSLSKQFEVHYLASPLRRENLELARALYDYGRIATGVISKEPISSAARQNLFPFARLRWQWGLASLALLILAVVGWSVFVSLRRNAPAEQSLSANANKEHQKPESVTGNQPSEEGTPEVSGTTKQAVQQSVSGDGSQRRSSSLEGNLASVVLSPQMRGTTNIPLVELPAKTERVAIRLELEPNDYSAYRAVLLSQPDGGIVWSSRKMFGQTKDGNRALNIHLPSRRLQSRSYVLQVYGLTESGKTEQMSDYHFRVLK